MRRRRGRARGPSRPMVQGAGASHRRPRRLASPLGAPWCGLCHRRASTRFIPAPAGNTSSRPRSGPRPAVHPRACGEHARAARLGFTDNGSSPRLRGNTHTPSIAPGEMRAFIPEHGEHYHSIASAKPVVGSSPRLRGTCRAAPCRYTEHAVHPRACGEHVGEIVSHNVGHGSSPRLRGTRPDRALAIGQHRFIPAPAGNTTARRTWRRWSTVHPRACGEHGAGPFGFAPFLGSSPRLRGTPFRHGCRAEVDRFIPAPAGNTICSVSTTSRRSVHPRACGEHTSGQGRMMPPTRFIPAPAGNTLVLIAPIRPLDGSSPRLRGTHRRTHACG